MQIAWFFPGQGSQAVGMAKDVLEVSAGARRVFEEADSALGEKLSTLILEGPEDRLTLTANAQPAILATSQAILVALKERIPTLASPAFAAGHSLGEYSALVASGALGLADAIRLLRARGNAMQNAAAPGVGAMAAIMGLDPSLLAGICEKAAEGQVVSPANYNAPGQVVIAGHAAAVERAIALASAAGGKAIPLKVSAPFHCALMAPAAAALKLELEKVAMHPMAFPVVANVDAQPNSDPARIKELLFRQVDGPVRWEDSVRFMHGAGVTRALEIGPGKVLSGLTRRIAKDITVLNVSDAASLDKVEAFLAG